MHFNSVNAAGPAVFLYHARVILAIPVYREGLKANEFFLRLVSEHQGECGIDLEEAARNGDTAYTKSRVFDQFTIVPLGMAKATLDSRPVHLPCLVADCAVNCLRQSGELILQNVTGDALLDTGNGFFVALSVCDQQEGNGDSRVVKQLKHAHA